MNSYTLDVQIPQNCVAHIIGKAGAGVNKLKADYHVKIDFENVTNDNKKMDRRSKESKSSITIQGIKKDVQAVKAIIEEKVEALVRILVHRVTLY
jgi:predicted PilT family ATPase